MKVLVFAIHFHEKCIETSKNILRTLFSRWEVFLMNSSSIFDRKIWIAGMYLCKQNFGLF